ncbi:MAG: protein-glutamate O-methyltransferase CheR [Thermodesulfovibrionales bacterium]|nr:protein-glutamate O-methyltransferase CheR [Thermodesulfovibrionales bacterium]
MADLTLTLDEFEKIADIIYKKAGIRFEAKKEYFLTKRIAKRMQELGIETPIEYIRLLRFADTNGTEMQNLINLLTVNETYFFRDFPQLQAFAEHCLYDVCQRKLAQGDNTLKIWSAGCSTGEEPYTLSIILHEMLDDLTNWKVQIDATDIDEVVLQRASEGVYERRSVKDVPPEYLQQYFVSFADKYLVKDKVKSIVRLEHLNLSDSIALRKKRGYDFIFCRNVLIYFDDASRKKVVDHFYIALNKGGYIFLSSSESLSRITTTFKLKRLGGNLVYTKE